MNVNKYLKLIFLFSIIFGLTSCLYETKPNSQAAKTSENVQDTIIVKQKEILNKSYEVGFLSKSYLYYWLVGKDTLDFVVNAREYVKDSTLHLSIYHEKPILFATTLAKINQCFSLIKEDFYLSKLNSLYFKEPIYYFDLVKELSAKYEQQFGQKEISYEKLDQFLLNSKPNKLLDEFVSPLQKKVKRYSIEKFHLINKIDYFRIYLPDVDLTEYPEFAIHGMGLGVQLESKPNL